MLNINNNTETAEKISKINIKKEIFYWIKIFLIVIVIAFVVQNFILTFVRVDGASMEPTYQHNDRLIVWRINYEPKQGDIVVFNMPTEDFVSNYWIKRVIATEGQNVKIDYATSSVYVDGKKIDEPYLGEPMLYNNNPITEITVPKDSVFVLGDNRNDSTDSRRVGPISEDEILGKVITRFWPINKMETY